MGPLRTLVLVGGPYHDAPENRAAFLAAVNFGGHLDLTVTEDHAALLTLEREGYQLLVVYTTRGTLAAGEEDTLARYVEAGHGLVGVHGASTSFHANPAYVALLGSTFVKHPPLQPIEVRVAEPGHPLMGGVDPFTVEDELYQLRLTAADLTILTTSRLGDLEQPSTYVRHAGRGRVWYTALGHDHRCLASPGFRLLLSRGIRWAAGG